MSESLPLISVIVPVYNVEKQLDRCVQSILKQTYSNIEIILVDDGSPDQCGKMCDNYAARYGIVHTIHQPNKGPAYARSVGVSASQGIYIAFCDSDDYLDEDIIEYLYHCILKNDCDISICAVKHHGFQKTYDAHIQNEKIIIRSGYEAAQNILLQKEGFSASLCHSLFLHSLFKREINATESGYCYEDLITILKAAFRAEKVCISNIQKYNYCYRASGSSSFSTEKRCKELELTFSKIEAQIAAVAPELQYAVNQRYTSNALQILRQINKNNRFLFDNTRYRVLQRKAKLSLCGKTDFILLIGLRMGRMPFYIANFLVSFLKGIFILIGGNKL